MSTTPLTILARVLQIRLYNSLLERKFSSSFSGLQFLVEKCGIPLKPDSSLAQKIHFDGKASSKVMSLMKFLKSHDFSEAEIAKLIAKQPRILRCRVSTNLNPKFQYLIENGFKGSLLRQIVLANPRICSIGLSSCIKPANGFMKKFLGSDERARAAIMRAPFLLSTPNLGKRMKHNIEYLEKLGMPISAIARLTVCRPMTMVLSNDRLVHCVEKVKDLGVMPHAPMFLNVLHSRLGMKEMTWKKKVEMFKSLGWSDEDVVSTFAKLPSCFSASEERLRTAMELFVNEMGIPREVIIACPVVLLYSLNERIWPRCSVVKVLKAEKLLDKWSISSLLKWPEEAFIRNFITKHLDRVPHLLEVYHGSKKSGKTKYVDGNMEESKT